MTYNTDPRKPLTKKQRAQLLLDHDHTCAWCGLLIVDDDWQDDHDIPREMGGHDDMSNRRPLHTLCHRAKTKLDVKAIAKSNRIRRAAGPKDDRRKTRNPIKTRPGFKWPSRPFNTRGKS